MTEKSPKTDDVSAVELHKVLSLEEVSELTTLSEQSLRRNHADKILHLSRRRVGMRLRDALAIGTAAELAK